MRAASQVLVKTDNNYNNKAQLGDTNATVNVDIDDTLSVNRLCTVFSSPEASLVNDGDSVIIHHNVMRDSIKNDGSIDRGPNFIKEGIYHCDDSEIIMKKIGGKGDWVCLHDFVFIKPELSKDVELGAGLVLVPDSRKGMVDLRATLKIGNSKLKDIKTGERVIFSKFSQHEFIIDGELLYKCELGDLLAVIENE
jgi:co-chaperonin GroES (HSP10)